MSLSTTRALRCNSVRQPSKFVQVLYLSRCCRHHGSRFKFKTIFGILCSPHCIRSKTRLLQITLRLGHISALISMSKDFRKLAHFFEWEVWKWVIHVPSQLVIFHSVAQKWAQYDSRNKRRFNHTSTVEVLPCKVQLTG